LWIDTSERAGLHQETQSLREIADEEGIIARSQQLIDRDLVDMTSRSMTNRRVPSLFATIFP
jgi:hypothetical protein